MTTTSVTAIPGIGGFTAGVLREHGFGSVEAIARTDLETLANVPGFGPTRARRAIDTAKQLVEDGGTTGEPSEIGKVISPRRRTVNLAKAAAVRDEAEDLVGTSVPSEAVVASDDAMDSVGPSDPSEVVVASDDAVDSGPVPEEPLAVAEAAGLEDEGSRDASGLGSGAGGLEIEVSILEGGSAVKANGAGDAHASKSGKKTSKKVKKPVQETKKPAKKAKKLVKKVKKPAKKLKKPAKKVKKPTKKAKKPVEKVKKPAKKVKRPTKKVKRPTKKAKKPVEKVTKPVKKVKKPVEKVKKPVEKVKKPAEKVKKPAEKTKKPVEKVKKRAKKTK